jgi:uncharacterized paraquat-inducible protein A
MKEEFPSLPEQGKNLAKFTFDVVKSVTVAPSVPVLVSEERQKERLDICKKCEYYSVRQNRCKKCGCFLSHKVKFGASACPIEKW